MEFREPKGIYQQIADRICERILQQEWQAGERIPSIRESAVELGVNPNTVTRSYQALLDREIILNQRGKGYFVTEGAIKRILEEMKKEFISNELPELFRMMRLLNMGVDEIAELFDDDVARIDGEDK